MGVVFLMKFYIKELRKKNKMTQTQFGKELGVTKQMVCQWERGDRVPQIQSLLKIKKVFNCSLDDLVSE